MASAQGAMGGSRVGCETAGLAWRQGCLGDRVGWVTGFAEGKSWLGTWLTRDRVVSEQQGWLWDSRVGKGQGWLGTGFPRDRVG